MSNFSSVYPRIPLKIDGRDVLLYQHGSPRCIFLWANGSFDPQPADRLLGMLDEAFPGRHFWLMSFSASDWNSEYSPWAAADAGNRPAFSGKGQETRLWIEKKLLSYLENAAASPVSPILMGYSLAGLFALWSTYESGCFSGALSASGSLWYPGWQEYRESHAFPRPVRIYLSLGGKEEHTRDPLMQAVGTQTRQQDQALRQDPNVRSHVLEWNPGGHFADAEKRLIKGIRWFLDNQPE